MMHLARKFYAATAALALVFSAMCASLPHTLVASAETITPPYSCPAVYDALIAMKEKYPDGMSWTNDDFYAWNGGGKYYGGYGCVAFAYLLSDAAFGTLPCTESTTFDPTVLRTGDILRQNGHSFIILEVLSDSVIIAEGNINESIMWGREISFSTLSGGGFEDYTTRYPDEFAFREDTLTVNAGAAADVPFISRDAVDLVWESANTAIATVDENGCVLGIANGTTTITAASATHTETIEVTVEGSANANPVPEGLLYEVNSNAGYVTITGYEGTASSLEIPAMIAGYPVTRIADLAFMGNETVKEIIFPETLIRIGFSAFYDTILENIQLPSSLEMIDTQAFCASNLTSALIPASVSVIGEGAFSYCVALTAIAVDLESNYFYSNEGVLYSKENHYLVAYPAGKSDEIYTISEGINGIESLAFNGAYQLTELMIPSTVEYMGTAPFDDCLGLKNFYVADDNIVFYDADGVLYSADGALIAYPIDNTRTSYTVKDGTTHILQNAFSFARYLTEINLPSSLFAIDQWAFSNCTALTEIQFPKSMTTIGAYAFSGCTSLTNVVIPKSVIAIEPTAFSKCELCTIYGYKGSCAETYATENNIPFEIIPYPTGDINLDAAVTIGDAIFLNRYIAEDTTLTLPDISLAVLDCNNDDSVDVDDSVWILKTLAGLQ